MSLVLDEESALDISFIIPALNEEEVIRATLDSIHEHASDRVNCEIILVDHGSTDKTVEIAKLVGARVLDSRRSTIAANRNYGASQSSGEVLVFLDADVRLTADWGLHIQSVLLKLKNNEKIVTGSHCGINEQPGWIEKNWFQTLALEKDSRHIGTGHLIIRRSFFEMVGGFNEQLETGEDYEFSIRARRLGAKILNNPELRVVHEGFPNDLISFMCREAWHGLGDLRSIKSFVQSRVALATSLFVILHILLVASIIFINKNIFLPVVASIIALLVFLLLASVIAKYSHAGIRTKLIALYLFYFYYWGRAGSFLKMIRRLFDSVKQARAR